MVKFLHLICGTTFFGIMVAAFYYITQSIKKNDQSLIDYSLKASYFGDGVIFFLVIIQIFTSARLVSDGHFTLAIPWIFIAYVAYGIISVLWLSILVLKLFYLSNTQRFPIALNMFYWLNTLLIFFFIIIIHDAITQSTWFDFFLGNKHAYFNHGCKWIYSKRNYC